MRNLQSWTSSSLFKQPEDWYKVTLRDLKEVGVPVSRLQLAELLEKKYPNFSWDRRWLLKSRLTRQRRFESAVAALFPVPPILFFIPSHTFSTFKGEEIKIGARKEAGLYMPETGLYMELDVFIPSLNLAFEYQVCSHHTTSSTCTPHILFSLQGEVSLHGYLLYPDAIIRAARSR